MKYKVLYTTLSEHRERETGLVKTVLEQAAALYIQMIGYDENDMARILCNDLCMALESLQDSICNTNQIIEQLGSTP